MTGKKFKAYWIPKAKAERGDARLWAHLAAEYIRLPPSVRTVRRWAKLKRIPKRVEKAL